MCSRALMDESEGGNRRAIAGAEPFAEVRLLASKALRSESAKRLHSLRAIRRFIARGLMAAMVCVFVVAASLWGADKPDRHDKDAKVGETGLASDKGADKSSEGSSDASSGTAIAPKPRPKARGKKGPEPWDAAKAAEEYRRIEFELALAKKDDIYMVIDADRREIQLKMRGTVVWNSRMDIDPQDSAAVGAFARRFAGDGDRLIRMLTSKHLFAAKEKTPDSILAIVGQVVKADPQLLQRDIPERFELKWGWDVILDVRTDIVGEPKSKFKNLEVGVIEALERPFGAKRLKIRLASDDALTLYRAASPGIATLVYSSK